MPPTVKTILDELNEAHERIKGIVGVAERVTFRGFVQTLPPIMICLASEAATHRFDDVL